MRRCWLILLCFCCISVPAYASSLQLITTVKPLQLLVVDIAGDAAEVALLQSAATSPHDFQLRSSDLGRLAKADMVLWFGPALEHYLSKPIRRFDHAVALYPDDQPGDVDAHYWLDVEQIHYMARRIAKLLSDRVPSRSAYFHANAARLTSALRLYDKSLASRLQRAGDQRYLFLHDGFSRFEARYDLRGGLVLSGGEGRMAGARHLAELREQLQAGEIHCVFREPQYPAAMLRVLTQGLDVPVVELDPMAGETTTAGGFMGFYRQLGEAFASCLVASP